MAKHRQKTLDGDWVDVEDKDQNLSDMQDEFEWYNFVTERYELLRGVPANLEDFMPQIPLLKNLYRVYKLVYASDLEAYKETIMAYISATDKGKEK